MNKVRETIDRYQMLQPGEMVLVGVSGGADSAALLDILSGGLPDLQLQIAVCHINHRLRGEESDQDEAFVRSLCERYGVKLFCFTEDIAAQAAAAGQSVELIAREVRYRHFERLAQQLGAKIATAHTLSDSIETMLHHLARGTGLRGLAGIPPVRGRIIRPLIELTRPEVEAYLAGHGLSYRTDSSNLSDAYTRNRIRHHLIPELYRLNPRLDLAAAHLQQLLRETEEYLQEKAAAALDENRAGQGFHLPGIKSLPVALRRAALVQLLREQEVEPEFACVNRMLVGMEKGDCCIELRRALFFVCKEEMLYIEKREEKFFPAGKQTPAVQIDLVASRNIIQINNKILSFFCDKYEHFKIIENIEKSLLKNLVDCDKIGDNARVRTRQAGDRFTHPNRHWTKSLKKLFNEYHIPPKERDSILVCADEYGVFWVEGFGADARVSPDGETRRAVEIKIAEESGKCAKTS
ncbi:MAG: tRNA lysidine(34) synthetase TilS [Provencibacterium sp.]|nr:tRNA lysidine(34) synthetase TilS [Provencibacterium sp.]